jgi:hypothetical protein
MVLDSPDARGIAKVNSALAPFAKFGDDVFGKENDWRGPADELVVLRIELRRDQPENGGAVRRGDGHQPVTGLKVDIQSQIESQAIPVEFQTPIMLFDKNVDGINAEVGILPIEANVGSAAHGRNYRGGSVA